MSAFSIIIDIENVGVIDIENIVGVLYIYGIIEYTCYRSRFSTIPIL